MILCLCLSHSAILNEKKLLFSEKSPRKNRERKYLLVQETDGAALRKERDGSLSRNRFKKTKTKKMKKMSPPRQNKNRAVLLFPPQFSFREGEEEEREDI